MLKGSHHTEKANEKNRIWHIGKPSPMKGRHHTAESNKKNSESHKGQTPWNKNKKGVMPPTWNKNLTKETDIRIKQSGLKGSISKKGKHYSPSTEFKKGMATWNKDKETPEVTRKKQSISKIIFYKEHPEAIARWYESTRRNIVLPVKDTTIEVKIQNLLRQLGIEFLTHQYINIKYAYQCDILIPVQPGINQKTIIECDGDYWHGNTKKFDFRKLSIRIKEQIPLDFERTHQLEEQGYRVIRLWGSEIKNITLEQLKDRIFSYG